MSEVLYDLLLCEIRSRRYIPLPGQLPPGSRRNNACSTIFYVNSLCGDPERQRLILCPNGVRLYCNEGGRAVAEKGPPSQIPAPDRANGGGTAYQTAHWQTRRNPATQSYGTTARNCAMFAGPRAKQGKSCGAKVRGLNRKRHGSPPAGFFASDHKQRKEE